MVALSIIIPCYNYGRYLKESLDSVLSQDYSDYEIILIDDASTDETPIIGKAYANEHSQIRYYRNPQNLGVFKTINIGFDAATGEYLHYFSSDDHYLPGFLSKSMHMLQNRDLSLVCSDVGYFQDRIEQKQLIKGHSKESVFLPNELPEVCRKTGFWVAGTSSIVRRELIERFGNFDPKLENISDWFLFHKIAFSQGVGYIPETLISMRVHKQAYTSQVKHHKKRRRATYHHLLHILAKNKDLRAHFLEAGLLKFIFRELKWKLYLNPRYACYWKR